MALPDLVALVEEGDSQKLAAACRSLISTYVPASTATILATALSEAIKDDKRGAIRTILTILRETRYTNLSMNELRKEAIEHGNRSAISLMQEFGYISLPGQEEKLLPFAAEKNADMIPFLIKSGANPNHTYGMNERTLLANLVELGMRSKEQDKAILHLLDNGASPDLPRNFPAMILVDDTVSKEALTKMIAASKNLEARGSFDGRTPFLHAVKTGNLPYMRLLKEAGADIHATRSEYNLARIAVQAAEPDTEREADVSGAAQLAVKHRKANDILAQLAEWDVPLDTRAPDGMTPFLRAFAEDKEAAAETLVALGADITADITYAFNKLRNMVDGNWEKAITLSLEQGADIYAPGQFGLSAWEMANEEVNEGLRANSAYSAAKMAGVILGWPDTVRRHHLHDEAGQPTPIHRDDLETPATLRKLAGAGLLQEAFSREHWIGREQEAMDCFATVLPRLMPAQQARYGAVDFSEHRRALQETASEDKPFAGRFTRKNAPPLSR